MAAAVTAHSSSSSGIRNRWVQLVVGILCMVMIANMFGREYATTNYGLLYMSKGVAALLVPVGGVIRATSGSWVPMFLLAIALNVLASVMCGTILPRMARAHVSKAAIEDVGAVGALVPAIAAGSN